MSQAPIAAELINIQHPLYDEVKMVKYRLLMKSGRDFLESYLHQHANEEDDAFLDRKAISYVPAFAKEAVSEVLHSMFQRLHDVTREGGSDSFQACISGEQGGVDGEGRSMTNFIGAKMLPELLFMGRVGVCVDNVSDVGYTRADVKGHPYLYIYKDEDILNWTVNANDPEFLQTLLVRDTFPVLNEWGLPAELKPRYRLYQLQSNGVLLSMFDESGNELPAFSEEVIMSEGIVIQPTHQKLLKIKHIPIVLVELSDSLLVDVADYQIALLNLASSDIYYAWASNFPFYTEMYDPFHENFKQKVADVPADFEPPADPLVDDVLPEDEILLQTANFAVRRTRVRPEPQTDTAQISVGPTSGRRYPKGTERPSFIHPSPEPLRASMDKEEQLKYEIRQLVYLAITNLQPKMASAASKEMDNQGLEAGMSYIGLEAEAAEIKIARLWSEFDQSESVAIVTYPETYDLKTNDERRKDAEELRKLQSAVPSRTFQKQVSKDISHTMYGSRLAIETLNKIDKEIENSKVPTADPEVLKNDHEAGFVSDATASEGRGYEPGEAKQAAIDHGERLARIKLSQSAQSTVNNPAARGLKDESGMPMSDATNEKANSQNHYQEKSGRGDAPRNVMGD